MEESTCLQAHTPPLQAWPIASMCSGPRLARDPALPGVRRPFTVCTECEISSDLLPGTLGFKLPLYPDLGLHQQVRGPCVTTVTTDGPRARGCVSAMGPPGPGTPRGQKQKVEDASEAQAAALSSLVILRDVYLHHWRWRVRDVLGICIAGLPVTPPRKLCRQQGGLFQKAAEPACSP